MMWEHCLKSWIKNEKEILVLQEFFGYLLLDNFYLSKALLLKDIQYRSARFPICLVAKELVGEKNTCGVNLEEFNNSFITQWFEKYTLNIATENIKYDESYVKTVMNLYKSMIDTKAFTG